MQLLSPIFFIKLGTSELTIVRCKLLGSDSLNVSCIWNSTLSNSCVCVACAVVVAIIVGGGCCGADSGDADGDDDSWLFALILL